MHVVLIPLPLIKVLLHSTAFHTKQLPHSSDWLWLLIKDLATPCPGCYLRWAGRSHVPAHKTRGFFSWHHQKQQELEPLYRFGEKRQILFLEHQVLPALTRAMAKIRGNQCLSRGMQTFCPIFWVKQQPSSWLRLYLPKMITAGL